MCRVATKMKAVLKFSARSSPAFNIPTSSSYITGTLRAGRFLQQNHRNGFCNVCSLDRRILQRAGDQRRFQSSFDGSKMSHVTSPLATLASSAIEPGSIKQDTTGLIDSVIQATDPVPAGWTPAGLAEYGIVAIHEAFGFPWYLSIAGITVALRTALFPLVIYQVCSLPDLFQGINA
jgi:membrane protein insertase Oxa1/YidC/SpoIIIJ